LGAPSLLDIVREFARGKLVDQIYGYLGGFGQWLEAYPLAFFTLSLSAAILAIVIVTIRESFVTESSAIYDDRGIPYQKQPITAAWTRGLAMAAIVCIGVISYGTYRYYQIAVSHFKLGANTNITPPVLPGAPPKVSDQPPSLSDLFTNDFPDIMKAANDITIEGIDLPMKQQVYLDFLGKGKFVGFYIPISTDFISGKNLYKTCMTLIDAVQAALDNLPKRIQMKAGLGLEGNTIEELTFTGRVVFYHQDLLSITQRAEIINAYKVKHFDVQFRGQDYLANQTELWRRQRDLKKGI